MSNENELIDRLKRELAESNERYLRLFENLADEVHLWKVLRDDVGKIVTWQQVDVNPVALKAWKAEKKDVVGKTTNEIFGPKATEQFMSTVSTIMETGEVLKWEEYFAMRRGELKKRSKKKRRRRSHS